MLPMHSNLPSVAWNLKASSPSLPKANAWTGRALTDEVSEHVNEHLSAINEHQVRFNSIKKCFTFFCFNGAVSE